MFSAEQQKILLRLQGHVQAVMPPDPTGHDWPHVWRVLKNAQHIAQKEGGDGFHIALIALTHDLYDHKFFSGTDEEARKNLENLLLDYQVERDITALVVNDVFSLSFSKSNLSRHLSHEGKIVQDADRLEAIGAIGIARAFAYGGFKNRLMNHSHSQPNGSERTGTTFDHFFEKLLKLFDLLNTNTAKEMARERFGFMQDFVKRFEAEWNTGH